MEHKNKSPIDSGREFARAVRDDRLERIVTGTTDPHFEGFTVGECLACGVSNPFAPEYPCIGDTIEWQTEIAEEIEECYEFSELELISGRPAVRDGWSSDW